MKKYLQILFLNAGLVATTFVTAQPVLTQSGVAYAVGDVISTTSYYGHYLNQGSAGINQTWDLSAMPDSSSNDSAIVSATLTPAIDSFPGATVAIAGGSSSYEFYNVTSSVMQRLGYATGTTDDFDYVNPEDILRFPFSYNNSYVDPWRAISYSGGNTRILSGTTTVTADGYGTVKIPGHTYSNAMRVHFYESYYDSLYIGIWYIHTWKVDSYKWYVNGYHYPVAEIDSTVFYYGGVQQGPGSYTGSYLNSPTGVKNVATINSFNIYPNPASDYLTIDINLSSAKNIEVKVFNALGAEMEVPFVNEGIAGDNRYRLDVQRLPQGIYFATILMNGVLTSTKQFIIAR